MPDTSGIVLEKYKEHRTQARQHETLRSSLVTFTAAAAGAVLGFAGSQGTDPAFKLAASAFLVLMGLFAALMAYKHYERFRYHTGIAKAYDKKLNEELAPPSSLSDHKKLKEEHVKRFGWIVEARAYLGWIAFPILIATLGSALLFLQVRALSG